MGRNAGDIRMGLTRPMDLVDVQSVRVAASRADVALAPGEVPMGGGTWLYSEPQPGTTGIVDLMGLGWESLRTTPDGDLEVAATCTLGELAAMPVPTTWPAAALFGPACEALLGSWKIQRFATVGGNICTALPAGPMTSLFSGLGADAVIWTPDGGERRMPVADLVIGVRTTALAPGEVLRSVVVPAAALHERAVMRRIALAELGRSASFVIGRRDGDGVVITVTAATPHPVVLRFADLPDAARLASAVGGIDTWYDDVHGAPDWRRAMTLRFAEELRVELASSAGATA